LLVVASPTILVASTAATHKFDIALGDLPTWALFVGAFIAAVIALRQLRIQQDDSARQTRQLERQQANDVDFTWRPAAKVMIIPPGSDEATERTVVIVENNSRRPIRDVSCWISSGQPPSRLAPLRLGPIKDSPGTNFEFSLYNARPETGHLLMRPGSKYGFLFEREIPSNDAIAIAEPRDCRPMVQFTDDADLTWQIDDDIRLQKVEAGRSLRRPW
jgi:hypothetical protein